MGACGAFFLALASSDPSNPSYLPLILLLLAVFLVGFFLGRRTANIRVTGSIGIDESATGTTSPRLLVTRVVRKMELKCKCGAVFKFADGEASAPSGYEPMPSADSYICPRCGNINDLTEARSLLKDAGV